MKCCDITPAKLREPVLFERQSETRRTSGSLETVWVPIATAPTLGMVTPVSGRERLEQERLDAQIVMRVVVRYFADLTKLDRITIRGQAYQIRYLENLEYRDRWWKLSLEGGVAIKSVDA